MAEDNKNSTPTEVEIKDRGVFDFLGNKPQEKKDEQVIVTEFDDKVKISEDDDEEKKKHSLLDKLHRSTSSSSSSSEEEVEEGGEKKKKKKKEQKGLKEKIQEKVHKEEDKKHGEADTAIPVETEKVEVEVEVVHPAPADQAEEVEKKGFLDKIKEKLPGQHKKTEQVEVPLPQSSETTAPAAEGDAKDKKGFLDKIKEKLPGYHPKPNNDHEEKETAAPHWSLSLSFVPFLFCSMIWFGLL